MLLGCSPLGAVPLGVAGNGLPDTILSVIAGGLTLSGGAIVVTVAQNVTAGEAISLSSSTTRVGSGGTVGTAAIAFAGGAPTVGIEISSDSALVLFSSNLVTIVSLLPTLSAEIGFDGKEPVLGEGIIPSETGIVFTGGIPITTSSIYPESGSVYFAGGTFAVGSSGLVPVAASIIFSSNALVVADSITSPFAAIWLLGGAVTEQSEAAGKVVVLNSNTLAVSEYDLDVLDVIEHEGEVYFVTATGLSKFAASGAQAAYILTGELDPIGGQEFNVPKVSIGAAGTGTLSIQTTTKERGTATTNTAYSIPLTAVTDQHEVLLETRQHARAYQFRVALTQSGDSLQSLDAYVNPVRHRRG